MSLTGLSVMSALVLMYVALVVGALLGWVLRALTEDAENAP